MFRALRFCLQSERWAYTPFEKKTIKGPPTVRTQDTHRGPIRGPSLGPLSLGNWGLRCLGLPGLRVVRLWALGLKFRVENVPTPLGGSGKHRLPLTVPIHTGGS